MTIKAYRTYTQDTIKCHKRDTITFCDCTNNMDMIWSDPIEIDLPDGHTFAPSVYGEMMIWDAHGEACYIRPLSLNPNGNGGVELRTSRGNLSVPARRIEV